MTWRQIKDFKSNIVFSASFDYDVDDFNFRNVYIPRARICRNLITNVLHVHNIASQTMGKVYFEFFQSLRLTNIVIH